MATNITTLVLSHSGVLKDLYYGKIGPSDLESAIFYCGCTRVGMFTLGAGLADYDVDTRDDLETAEDAESLIRIAITAADSKGRVAWREHEGSNSWEQLNELLIANHHSPIQKIGSYDPRVVEEAVVSQDLPYRVIVNY